MFQVKEGDLDKLGLLFERYKKMLFAFFYRINRDKDLSEDLVQNVFMRVLKYKHAFKGSGEFKTWLFHIARNVSHDHFRQNKKLGHKDDIMDWDERLTAQKEEEEVKLRDEQLQLLNTAIEKLSEEKRELISMSKLKGMKYKEIGEILDCSEGAVKVKVFRALKDLKSIYDETKLSYE